MRFTLRACLAAMALPLLCGCNDLPNYCQGCHIDAYNWTVASYGQEPARVAKTTTSHSACCGKSAYYEYDYTDYYAFVESSWIDGGLAYMWVEVENRGGEEGEFEQFKQEATEAQLSGYSSFPPFVDLSGLNGRYEFEGYVPPKKIRVEDGGSTLHIFASFSTGSFKASYIPDRPSLPYDDSSSANIEVYDVRLDGFSFYSCGLNLAFSCASLLAGN